ncbi:NAD(P)-binding protein [Aspergillus stella-maris]|uniref:NAD(P)-binding protein n=1 Tax=Aspergillus stella-maris TaxID=1810926 RepID=UPI003CCE44A8
MSTLKRQTVVLAGGTGDLAQYLREELVQSGRYSVVLLTRKNPPRSTEPHTTVHKTDYTTPSLLNILNTTNAHALISTIRCPNSAYIPLHTALVNACLVSKSCKTFIPSEWGGNIDDFPDLPLSYDLTRGPFRKQLEAAAPNIRSTIVNIGWFMDYFVPERCSHMKYIPGEFPIDVQNGKWEYTVIGTGDEMQSWVLGRDVARAVVALLGSKEDWEPVTYVSGGWSTFNAAAAVLGTFYGRSLNRKYRSVKDINTSLAEYNKQENREDIGVVELEQCILKGALAVPMEKTLWQRDKYFSGINFMSLEEVVLKADKGERL